LQCVAVCCSVLQCVAVCCSVLQCVAVCCSVLQYVVAHIEYMRKSRTSCRLDTSCLFLQATSSSKLFSSMHTVLFSPCAIPINTASARTIEDEASPLPPPPPAATPPHPTSSTPTAVAATSSLVRAVAVDSTVACPREGDGSERARRVMAAIFAEAPELALPLPPEVKRPASAHLTGVGAHALGSRAFACRIWVCSVSAQAATLESGVSAQATTPET